MKRIFIAVLLLFITSTSRAAIVDVNAFAGAGFSKPTNTSNVQLNEFVTNFYDNNENHKTGLLAGIGIGHTFEQIYSRPFDLNLNLMAYYVSFGILRGIEHPFVNAGDFDTLNYQFRAESFPLIITPRLIYTSYNWQPYIFAGIGVSWNRAYEYNENATDTTAAFIPTMFGNQIIAAFAYQVGFGVQRQIYQDIKKRVKLDISMDYRYMNLGKGQLGTFPEETTSDHLKIPRLSTQAIVLTLNAGVA